MTGGSGVDIGITALVAAKVGFASHQNAAPLLRDLAVTLRGAHAMEGLALTIAADPPFLQPKMWRIDRLCPGDQLLIADRDVRLDATILQGLTESLTASVTLTLRDKDGAALAATTHPVELLAYNEWGGLSAMAELLAAFVMPNDPAVDRVLKAASDALRRAGKARRA